MVYEARYYSRPVDEVVEVNELKERHAQAKAAAKAMAEAAKAIERQRIREKILRKVKR